MLAFESKGSLHVERFLFTFYSTTSCAKYKVIKSIKIIRKWRIYLELSALEGGPIRHEEVIF